ncbi:signal transduction histidine kinase [Leptolyngbya sp. PCC 7375]|nr:signal transduction histidine kinase [Leptolyngbya sp. PCC 7375]
MKHWPKSQAHPFRVLYIIEWILLGIAVSELPWESLPYLSGLMGSSLAETEPIPFAWLWSLMCLLLLGLLGRRLPIGSAVSKWGYTAVQIGLILVATSLANWQSPFLMPYLVVMIRGYLIFSHRERWVLAGLTFGIAISSLAIPLLDIPRLQSAFNEPLPLTTDKVRTISMVIGIYGIVLCGLVSAFVLLLVNALLAERASRQQLTVAHHRLRQYALRIQDQAALQERNRIAREIHDAVGHSLTALRIQLENARLFSHSDTHKTEDHLKVAQQLAAKALSEIRQSVSTLQSDPLQGRSLITVLEQLCLDFQQQTKGEFVYTLDVLGPLPTETSATVYRLLQEAMTNVARHSHADRIKLQVKTESGYLWLILEDNGIGFDLAKNTAGFGLSSMKERTAAMGGHLQFITAPGEGCQLRAQLPLVEVMA